MFSGRGLPSERDVKASLSWLSGADDLDRDTFAKISALLSTMLAKHRISGIPDMERLGVYERQLLQLFPFNVVQSDHCRGQLKQLVFYAASKKGDAYVVLKMFELFLKGYASYFTYTMTSVPATRLQKNPSQTCTHCCSPRAVWGLAFFWRLPMKKGGR